MLQVANDDLRASGTWLSAQKKHDRSSEEFKQGRVVLRWTGAIAAHLRESEIDWMQIGREGSGVSSGAIPTIFVVASIFALFAALITVLVIAGNFLNTRNAALFHPQTLSTAYVRALVLGIPLLVGILLLVALTNKWNPFLFWIPLMVLSGILEQKISLGRMLLDDLAAPERPRKSFVLVIVIAVIGGVLHAREHHKRQRKEQDQASPA